MHIILTVDDNWGMSFNHRRLSRDKVLNKRILELSSPAHLWISEASQKLFTDHPAHLVIDNDFTSKAGVGDYCFVESADFFPTMERIEDIIVFHWNRTYPSDQVFDRNILTTAWMLASSSDFEGHSHEKITEERYVRR